VHHNPIEKIDTSWRRGLSKAALGVSVIALTVFAGISSGNGADATASAAPAVSPDMTAAAPAVSPDAKGKKPTNEPKTASPIKHVIVLIGENRGLDHTFGTYQPKGNKQTISNLLSKGIVNADGTPGPNFALAQQFSVSAQPTYYIGPPNGAKTPYGAINVIPQPNTNGAPTAQSDSGAPFKTIEEASIEPDVQATDTALLTTGFTGLPTGVLDARVPGAGKLPNGPFLLQGPELSDDDYTGDMTHRYYQAFQQQDCSLANATKDNPTGCLNDLFAFVMATYAAHNNSAGNEMGFLNAQQEQATLHKQLADEFTLSDNFHQSFLGGTGANHFMLGTGDAAFWSDGAGNATTPPSNIANPNPVRGTVNQYTADNNFSNCSDVFQPGVGPIVSYIESLPYAAQPNCRPNHYYMLDNTNPGFLPNGALAHGSSIPPSPVKTIGDALNDEKITWAFYGGAYNDAVVLSNEAVAANPANPDLTAAALADPAHALGVAYCQICNPFQYATSIMGNAAVRTAHMKDTSDLIAGIQDNTLPSVSFGKPDGLLDGHPQSSKIDLFEAYVQNILDALDANPTLKADTAVIITYDEAGGYYDSGFVQPLDFFGDGPRIPLLVVSPYSTGGNVVHTYADHVSILKFIEHNWHLQPLTDRSRDNLPNPKARHDNAYVPANMPAISDLFDMFDFDHPKDVHYRRGRNASNNTGPRSVF
jgi:phospholipase C